MPGIDYGQLRAVIGMSDVLALLGFEPRSVRGPQWRGPCLCQCSAKPKSSVFSVHVVKNTFRCFRCGVAGNQLDLWALCTQQPLYAAALDLCQRLDCVIPWLPPRQSNGGPRRPAKPAESQPERPQSHQGETA
jgi:hypothetical protein